METIKKEEFNLFHVLLWQQIIIIGSIDPKRQNNGR